MTSPSLPQLREWIAQTQAFAQQLGQPALVEELAKEDPTRVPKTMTIGFFGEFNRGKSTVINSLLGSNVMPVGTVPTTATTTRIMAGEHDEIHVQFPGNADEVRPLADDAWGGLTLGDEIRAYPTVEVTLVNPWLADSRITLLDTPGLNATTTSGLATPTETLAACDVAVLVISAISPFSMVEKEWMQQPLIRTSTLAVVIVMTHLDGVEEIERTLTYVRGQVAKLTPQQVEVIPFFPPQDARAEASKIQLRTTLQQYMDANTQADHQRQRVALELIDLLQHLEGQAKNSLDAATQHGQYRVAQQREQRDAETALDRFKVELGSHRAQIQHTLLNTSRHVREDVLDQVKTELNRPEALQKDWIQNALPQRIQHAMEQALQTLQNAFQRGVDGDLAWLQTEWEQIFTKKFGMPFAAPTVALPGKTATLPRVVLMGNSLGQGRTAARAGTLLSLLASALLFQTRKVVAILVGGIGSSIGLLIDQLLGVQQKEQQQRIFALCQQQIEEMFTRIDDDVTRQVVILYNDLDRQIQAAFDAWQGARQMTATVASEPTINWQDVLQRMAQLREKIAATTQPR